MIFIFNFDYKRDSITVGPLRVREVNELDYRNWMSGGGVKMEEKHRRRSDLQKKRGYRDDHKIGKG